MINTHTDHTLAENETCGARTTNKPTQKFSPCTNCFIISSIIICIMWTVWSIVCGNSSHMLFNPSSWEYRVAFRCDRVRRVYSCMHTLSQTHARTTQVRRNTHTRARFLCCQRSPATKDRRTDRRTVPGGATDVDESETRTDRQLGSIAKSWRNVKRVR